jgi:hypothetical protein
MKSAVFPACAKNNRTSKKLNFIICILFNDAASTERIIQVSMDGKTVIRGKWVRILKDALGILWKD